jgi:hypothetical protein
MIIFQILIGFTFSILVCLFVKLFNNIKKTSMIIFQILIGFLFGILVCLFGIIIRFNLKFKRDSKFPCYRVTKDYFISEPMYYSDAKEYSDKIHGTIRVDREEFNRLKKEQNK